LAVNLTKLANDLRLLSSGPLAGIGEIILPPVQEGSSIMPGKVNPVMCEMINQVAVRVFGNDAVVTQAAAMGQLELNAFLPAMVDALLDSMTLLKNGIRLFRVKCIEGLVADVKRCEENLRGSLGLLTVLSRRLGHQTAAEVYREHLQTRAPVSDILRRLNLVTEEEISRALADFCRKGNA
jgi:aspartate ammonia-lyase